MLGPGGAQHDGPQFFQRLRAERAPPVPERAGRRRDPGPRPWHPRQVPGQARSSRPERPRPASRSSIDGTDHERPGQYPFPFPLHVPLLEAPPVPRCRRSRPAPSAPPATPPVVRASRDQTGCPAPAPASPDLRRRHRHDLQDNDRVAAQFSRSPRRPAPTGHPPPAAARSATAHDVLAERTATISRPPPGTALSSAKLLAESGGTGYEDRRGSCDEG